MRCAFAIRIQPARIVEYLDKRVLKGGQKLWDKIQRDPMLFLELINEYNNK